MVVPASSESLVYIKNKIIPTPKPCCTSPSLISWSTTTHRLLSVSHCSTQLHGLIDLFSVSRHLNLHIIITHVKHSQIVSNRINITLT